MPDMACLACFFIGAIIGAMAILVVQALDEQRERMARLNDMRVRPKAD